MDGTTGLRKQQTGARSSRGEFHGQLVALLPKLRVQALALTRNRAAAEDLVQDAVANALAAQDSFTPGTNFAAWMHRILRNRFISTLRKQRETTDIEDLPMSAFAVGADPVLPDRGLAVLIAQPRLDLDAWHALLADEIDAAGQGGGQTPDEQAFSLLPSTVSVVTQQLRLAGKDLHDVVLGA